MQLTRTIGVRLQEIDFEFARRRAAELTVELKKPVSISDYIRILLHKDKESHK